MSNENPSQNKSSAVAINKNINAIVTCYDNVDQSVISITEDKVELILRDHLKKVEANKSWVAPLGIFASLILSLITTTGFKTIPYLTPVNSWKLIIYLAAAGSLIWLIYTLKTKWQNKGISIRSIIAAMKKNEGGSI